MELPPQKIIEQLRSVTLSDRERAMLRTKLIAHIYADGVRQIVPSPWTWLFRAKHLQVIVLSLVIIASYGSSVTLAAEGALPGDVLYPVKIHVIESVVRIITATSPAAEATFETTLLERRLEEAESLDIRKELDPELTKVVREGVRKQSIKAKQKIRDVGNVSAEPLLHDIKPTLDKGTSSPDRVSDKNERHSNSNNERGNDNKRALKGVREKHKHILEKLDLAGDEDDKGGRE